MVAPVHVAAGGRLAECWLRMLAQTSALEVENLRGDNQYRCELCRAMVDATRQLRLRALPPYLCLSLKRFVFDMRVRLATLQAARFRVLSTQLCQLGTGWSISTGSRLNLLSHVRESSLTVICVRPLQTMNKVKVSDKFRFPLELDLGAFLPPELAAHSSQYDLTAILIHKGPSASHGHYGALPPAHAMYCRPNRRPMVAPAFK